MAAWGYSGGSFASGWTAVEHARYAPELNLTGVAVGGFVTRPGEAVHALNGGPFSGFFASLFPGILRANPDIAQTFNRYLTPAGKRLLASGDAQCLVSNLAQYPFINMDNYLTIPFDRLMSLPAVRNSFAAMNLGADAPTAPVFVYQAVHDELVPDAYVGETVRNWCKAGARVTFTRDQLSEHASLHLTGGPLALNWLDKRLAGSPVPAGCSTTTMPSTAFAQGELDQLPSYLQAAYRGFLGERLTVADVG